MNLYACDFETCDNINNDGVRVWAAGIINIETGKFMHFNSIDKFFEYIAKNLPCKCYFHNLKFDGSYILNYILCKGYKYEDKISHKGEFNSVISDTGLFYKITIQLKAGSQGRCHIFDSLKIIPLKIQQIPLAFGLKESKGEIDYVKIRPEGYIPTKQEIEYLRHDCSILSSALRIFFKQGVTKMTQAGNAYHEYQELIGGQKTFRRYYPVLNYQDDKEMRQAYRGGFVYCNPDVQEKVVGKGMVLDVNSLYPSVMLEYLPYGEPKLFCGEYEYDEEYPLFIQMIIADFKLKERHLPTLQLKHSMQFSPTEYLKDSEGQMVPLVLTNIDLKLFKEHYEIYDIKYARGWKFKQSNIMFDKYIKKWMKIKYDSGVSKNYGMKNIAKLFLNSLSGKFGTSKSVASKIPYMNGDKLGFTVTEEKMQDGVYLPVSIFITSIGRYKTISTAQKLYDRFLYSDTDSIHLRGWEEPDVEIDDNKLGCWKIEAKYDKAKYLRAKTYMYKVHNKIKVVCAGMPPTCHGYVTFDNFNFGKLYPGKLIAKQVKGGMRLEETDFKIKK